MDSFELNKIIGAILGTLLFVMGIGFVAEAIYHPITGQGPGYDLPAPPAEGDGNTTTPPPATALSIGTLLASADPKAGEASAKKCQACHDLTSGGPNKTGPNLYDVVERVMGSHPGFGYSPGMLEHQAKGDTWTYENLNQFITSPKAFVPGTKMTFAGIKDDKERANVIAFLSTLSASPKPFPPADAAPAPAAPADTSSSAAPADTSSSAAPADTSSSSAPADTSSSVASSESSAAQ